MRLISPLLLFLLLASRTVAAQEPLIVAGIGGQPPFAVLGSDGTMTGLEPDLIAVLCAHLDEPCTMTVAPSWSDLIGGLQEGRYAIGFGGLSANTPESLGITASTPYLPLLAQRAVIAHLAGASDPLDVGGLKVGVIRGTPHALWLEAHLPGERLRRFADDEEMFLSLHTGSVDAVFGDGLVLWRDLLQAPLGQGVVLAGPGIAVEQDGLVLALSGEPALAGVVNAALDRMAQDSTLAALLERHLPGLPLP